jgi:integrase/recombinase XerD
MDGVLEQFLDECRYHKGQSPHTIEAYGRDIQEFLEGNSLWPPNRFSMAHFVESLQKRGLAHATLSRKLSALKSFFKFLYREKMISEQLFIDIQLPKKPKQLPKALEETSVTTMMECPVDSKYPLRDKALLEVMYGCGLRVSECVSLTMKDVNIEEGWLTVIGKGNKERKVPLGDKATEALRVYFNQERKKMIKKDRGSDYLFLGRGGKGLTRQSVFLLTKQHSRSAGIHPVSPHALRHSFATHLVDHDADIRVVQSLLGHASITTTQVYTRVSRSRLKSVYQKAHPRNNPL